VSFSTEGKDPSEVAQKVKDAVDFRKVVGETHQIEKRYADYAMVLCPFHDDTNASMRVDRDGYYKCWACDASGDLIDWVQEIESVGGFWDAVQLVAKRQGLDITFERSPSGEKERKKAIRNVLENALSYYRKAFVEFNVGERAREYLLEERGLSSETLEEFRVGYAPKEEEKRYTKNVGPGVKEEVLLEAGILQDGEFGVYSPWEGRVIFPIEDRLGRPIGMAGRVVPGKSNSDRKYINSPETSLYKKSDVLYGLSRARRPIRSAGQAVVVEGYTDVLQLHSIGLRNVVATCGTSFTDKMAKALERVTDRVMLVLDGDEAGRSSEKKALGKLLPADVIPTIVPMPIGKDPADLVGEVEGDEPDEEVRSIIENREMGFVEFMRMEAKRTDQAESPEGRAELKKHVAVMIGKIDNRILRNEYIKDAARGMDVLPEAMYEMVQAARGESVKKRVWKHFKTLGLRDEPASTNSRSKKREKAQETGGADEEESRRDGKKSERSGSAEPEESRRKQRQRVLKRMAERDLLTRGKASVSAAKKVAKKAKSKMEERPEMVERLILCLGLKLGCGGLEGCRRVLEAKKIEDRAVRQGFRKGWEIMMENRGEAVSKTDFPYEYRAPLEKIGAWSEEIEEIGKRVGIDGEALQERPEAGLRGALAGWRAFWINVKRKEVYEQRQRTLEFETIKLSLEEERRLKEEEGRVESLIEGRKEGIELKGQSESAERTEAVVSGA
jgi:DNA primase